MVGILRIFEPYVDPLGWFYYGLFSLTALYAARPFKRWSLSRTRILDLELRNFSTQLEKEKEVLTV